MKIAVIANSAWYLYNFRRNLMRALAQAGHQPIAVSAADPYAQRLREEGFEHRPLPLEAAGTQPLRELATLASLRRLLQREQVATALTYTPKANIYTGLVARSLRFAHVPNVSGLGRVFIRPSPLTPLVRVLYRQAFKHALNVVFQNEDDRELFVRMGLVERSITLRTPGSGVDIDHFRPNGPNPTGAPRFLLVARMLWDKGVGEYVEAARALRADHPEVEFHLLGSSASDNPAAVPAQTLRSWQETGVVRHTEHVDDVRPLLAQAHCVVLPSYREGVPRSLLEAASMGKPLIATDAPGCRDTVIDGVNGFLCRPRDAKSLEQAMRSFLALSPQQQAAMGEHSRSMVEREFDESLVIATYLELIERSARNAPAARG